MSPIPSNVINKDLYLKIKQGIHNELEKKGTRWGIYASSRLVSTYKKMGGKYSDDNKNTQNKGLNRWFEQEWINICKSNPPDKIVKCGRKKIQNNQEYPVCRPYKRVNEFTPTTYGEMDKKDIDKICNKKRKNPLQILPKFH
jgi:hypothetical protein